MYIVLDEPLIWEGSTEHRVLREMLLGEERNHLSIKNFKLPACEESLPPSLLAFFSAHIKTSRIKEQG